MSSGNIIRKFRGHDGAVNSVRYSPNCEVIASGGYDQSVKVWDCRSRSVDAMQVMRPFRDSVTSVLITARHDILAGSVDGSLRRFDVRIGRAITDILHHPVTCAGATKDGNGLLAACMDSCIRLLDRADGDLLAEFRGHVHSSTKLDALLTPSDGYIVGCSEDGRVLYWEVVEGDVVEEFRAHGAAVCSMSMHPEGQCLLTSSVDGTVKVWR